MTSYLLLNFGYFGLFGISFLAATLLPLGSEAAVVLMAVSDADPWVVLGVATFGNSLGALVNYHVGKRGAEFLFARYVKIDRTALQRARNIYGKWGSPILFFAWLPVIGDPLTVAAGVLKVNVWLFLFWVVLGKGLRYLALLWGVAGSA